MQRGRGKETLRSIVAWLWYSWQRVTDEGMYRMAEDSKKQALLRRRERETEIGYSKVQELRVSAEEGRKTCYRRRRNSGSDRGSDEGNGVVERCQGQAPIVGKGRVPASGSMNERMSTGREGVPATDGGGCDSCHRLAVLEFERLLDGDEGPRIQERMGREKELTGL